MARRVEGYMSNSGIFFDNYDDARRKDAEDKIRELSGSLGVKADSLLHYIEAMADPIKEYIDAYQASQNVPKFVSDREDEPDTSGPRRYQSDDNDGSEDPAAVE